MGMIDNQQYTKTGRNEGVEGMAGLQGALGVVEWCGPGRAWHRSLALRGSAAASDLRPEL